MILISHRGNINGRLELMENHPDYVDIAIKNGYDVEIDIWVENGELWLGHDLPTYHIEFDFIKDRLHYLWVHCKNIESLVYFKEVGFNSNTNINYFWHENDKATLTSHGYLWVHPNTQPIINGIAVMPEINNYDVSKCLGVCSDYVEKYKNL